MTDHSIHNTLQQNPEKYWNDRYQNGLTGWDMHQVSPPLKSYIDTLENKNISILIPGCGNAYEAAYLLEKGFKNISLIDISQHLVESLRTKFKDSAINIFHEDFFNHEGKYDLILEQTFFCAIDPSLRGEYVKKVFSILNSGGRIAGLLFNKKTTPQEPPFFATDKEYAKLFSEKFKFLIFEECLNSIAPRQGSELFFEFEKP